MIGYCGYESSPLSPILTFTTTGCAANILKKQREKNFESDIHLFPNPANQQITIQLNKEKGFAQAVSISDVNGKIWYSQTNKISDKRIELNTSKFPPGVYFIHIQYEQSWQEKKFIVFR